MRFTDIRRNLCSRNSKHRWHGDQARAAHDKIGKRRRDTYQQSAIQARRFSVSSKRWTSQADGKKRRKDEMKSDKEETSGERETEGVDVEGAV